MHITINKSMLRSIQYFFKCLMTLFSIGYWVNIHITKNIDYNISRTQRLLLEVFAQIIKDLWSEHSLNWLRSQICFTNYEIWWYDKDACRVRKRPKLTSFVDINEYFDNIRKAQEFWFCLLWMDNSNHLKFTFNCSCFDININFGIFHC